MDIVLHSFKSFIEDIKNIYGFTFFRTMSKDSTLATMSFVSRSYPATGEIYARYDSLRQYISSQKANVISPPMLNVTNIGDTVFNTMVALSVDRRLKGNGRIVPKGFVPYKMMEGEVKGGGVHTIEKAFEQMQKYKLDYNTTIMAMPFQSLITDRRQEPDTTRWVTLVCAPIS